MLAEQVGHSLDDYSALSDMRGRGFPSSVIDDMRDAPPAPRCTLAHTPFVTDDLDDMVRDMAPLYQFHAPSEHLASVRSLRETSEAATQLLLLLTRIMIPLPPPAVRAREPVRAAPAGDDHELTHASQGAGHGGDKLTREEDTGWDGEPARKTRSAGGGAG